MITAASVMMPTANEETRDSKRERETDVPVIVEIKKEREVGGKTSKK